jgi:hypothetical protein
MKQISNEFIATLKTLPNSCVYVLISDSTGKVIVSHSNAFSARLSDLIDYFGEEDTRGEILQELDDSEGKLILCEIYKRKYSAAGYKIVNVRPYINYKVSIQYSYNLQRAHVVLYNARRDKTVVGQFKSMEDARSFVEQYYKGREVISVVYAIGYERYIN